MAALALVICLATRVKAHERWRTLLLVTQFGLFPSNLNALQLFFCRTPKTHARAPSRIIIGPDGASSSSLLLFLLEPLLLVTTLP